MKKIILLIAISCHIGLAQYAVKCQYLQTPELVYGYVDSCAKFWEKAYEPSYGGFYQNIDQMGNLKTAWGTNKNTLNQSRDAYGFTRAFQLTGDTTYLRYAKYGLDFMYAHAWDNAYGGWINSINSSGGPASPNDNKSAYFQHYALLGITAHFEATRDTNDWNWLMKSYDYNEQKLWDISATNFGYYDYVAANGTSPTDKSFNATVDAITTHILNLYLMTGEQKYKTRLLQLADNMINHLAASSATQVIGFAERYTSSWAIKSGTDDEKRTIMGHVLKTGWCLARIYELEKDSLYLSTAEQLVQMVLDKGYDHQNGGPYKDYYRMTGQMMMYGQDTAKAWWQMEQAVTSGLMLYQITGKEKYLQMADETLNFFMTYFVDHVYGEVFADRTKYGKQVWGLEKGNDGKAAYHSIELGYYTYLYGKLLAKNEPAKLYYQFLPENRDRSFVMRPVGLPQTFLKIKSVTLNGAPYANFDASNLVLTVLSGTGGIFAVTYERSAPTKVFAQADAMPQQFQLMQNYPNPFNPTTSLSYQIPVNGFVSLKVYDAIGREVATLAQEVQDAGLHSVQFTGAHLSSGIYFARLESNGKQMLKKMMLLK